MPPLIWHLLDHLVQFSASEPCESRGEHGEVDGLLPKRIEKNVLAEGCPLPDLPGRCAGIDQIQECKSGFVVYEKDFIATDEDVGIRAPPIVIVDQGVKCKYVGRGQEHRLWQRPAWRPNCPVCQELGAEIEACAGTDRWRKVQTLCHQPFDQVGMQPDGGGPWPLQAKMPAKQEAINSLAGPLALVSIAPASLTT